MGRNQESTWNEALTSALVAAAGRDVILFYERREDLSVTVTDRTRPQSVHTYSCGAAAGETDRRLAYRADPAPDDLRRLVEIAIDERPRLPETASRDGGAEPPPPMLGVDEAGRVVSELVEQAVRIQRGARVTARWVGFEQRVRVARADRSLAEDVRSAARIRVEARLSAGESTAEAVVESVLAAGRTISREKVIGLAHQVTERLERRLEAVEPPSGEATVVFAPGVGGILIHEIVGHALEADVAAGGESWLTRYKERWIPEELTVVDDPRRSRAAWRFDDEAEAARATPLLRGGQVAGWLHDRRSAAETGQRPTGHGRRASYRDSVVPRMGATFLAAGDLCPEEVIDGAREGIYVRRMEAATTDPRTGRATFRVTDADLIVGGRVGAPLHSFLLCIDGQTTLRRMTRIADDLRFDTCIGSCHRDGQALAISVGAPTFCIGVAEVAP